MQRSINAKVWTCWVPLKRVIETLTDEPNNRRTPPDLCSTHSCSSRGGEAQPTLVVSPGSRRPRELNVPVKGSRSIKDLLSAWKSGNQERKAPDQKSTSWWHNCKRQGQSSRGITSQILYQMETLSKTCIGGGGTYELLYSSLYRYVREHIRISHVPNHDSGMTASRRVCRSKCTKNKSHCTYVSCARTPNPRRPDPSWEGLSTPDWTGLGVESP